MRRGPAALCGMMAAIHMNYALADIRPEQTHTALTAIEHAKALVAAGRGQLLLVGATLSTEDAPSQNVVVILEYPIVRDMKPGMILILAKNDCEPLEGCLIARRVSEIDVKGDVQTDPYRTEELLFARTQATLLGVVSYAIDLDTDSIRDMRAGREQESLTLARAIAEEQAQARGDTARF